MIIANFTPQEICIYLKLCSDENKPGLIVTQESNEIGKLITNLILCNIY